MVDFISSMLGGRKIEIFATIFGLINITLIVRRSVWNYPFGLVMVSLYFFIFMDAKLYGNMLLQLYFVGMQLFGWYWWLKKTDNDGRVVVERISPKLFLIWIIVGLITVLASSFIMGRYTDAAYPLWDMSIVIGSVLAMYFMARRWLESWVLWIIVDIVAVGLYWKQGLYPTSALYAVFLVMAIIGFMEWYRYWRADSTITAP